MHITRCKRDNAILFVAPNLHAAQVDTRVIVTTLLLVMHTHIHSKHSLLGLSKCLF